VAFALGLEGNEIKDATKLLFGIYRAYLDTDASLVEINPLITTKDHRVIALDAKVNFDDNALFRHKDIMELRDVSEEAPLEVEASKYGLNYIKLDGNVGCMVNGAGLAMTTMDIIKLFGGEPANFLDIGGGASAEKVSAALRIILSDPNVKAVLFNVFGGITRGDEVARGVLAALDEVKTDVPMVVRLVGTNAEEGRAMLADANMITAETLADAARKAVAVAKGEKVK
jgi:succinyl-CoA synthetase beta subunit